MTCSCQSGKRTLRIRLDAPRKDYPELEEFAGTARWSVVSEGSSADAGLTLLVPIGGEAKWQSISDLSNFLRTILTEERMKPLYGAWLDEGEVAAGGCCSTQNLHTLGGADTPAAEERPLVEMTPLDASPLVEILKNRRIETWFQPVFRSGSHQLWGYECLMRARDAEGSVINPGTLLDWARQEHLIFMLDRICRETHITNAAALPKDSSILINFLPTAIYEPSFCLRTTHAAVKAAGIDRQRVIFEVVESEQITDTDHLPNILSYYRKAGFKTALDDVGSGYAGLSLLADLSPDLIKIDRELVQRAAESKMHRIICNALVQIARQSGKLCLAEGIETKKEYEIMRSIGIDLVQGFYFAKPAPQPALTTEVQPIPGQHRFGTAA